MSEVKNNQTEQPCGENPVNASRRKLTGAVLAGPVVLGTLASKQALGGTPYHCTISGQISGTDSVRPAETVACSTLGRSPSFWKNHWTCWDIDGLALNGTISVEGIFRPFNAIFVGSSISDRMGDILHDCVSKPLEKAAIASYLNAKHFSNSYPLTTAQVLAMYASAGSGPVGNFPNLQGYFESLYGNSDDWPVGASNVNCPSDPDGFTCDTPTPAPAVSFTGILIAGNGRTTAVITNVINPISLSPQAGGAVITCTTTSTSYSCTAAPGNYTLKVQFPTPGSSNSQNAVCINGAKSTTSPAQLSISLAAGGALPTIKVIKGGDTC